MGFRNPITTAVDPVARQAIEDVGIEGRTITGAVFQTAPEGTPRLRLTQTTDTQTPEGVAEFHSGRAGAAPARLALVTYRGDTLNPDGTVTDRGNSFQLRGGATNDVTPATWDLDVEDPGTGVYRSVLRGSASLIDLNGPLHVDDVTSAGPIAAAGRGNAVAAGLLSNINGGASSTALATPIVRAGSAVLALNANGNGTITWSAFPNGLTSVSLTPGDTAGNLNAVQAVGHGLGFVHVRGTTPGGALAANVTVRINWQAIGW